MKKALYIHIGVHKTGSTAIQQYLFINKDKLKEIGVLYPGNKNNHYGISNDLRKDKEPWLNEESETFKVFTEIKNNLFNYQKFILSSEGFCENYKIIVPQLKKTLEYFNLDIQIKIITFYRKQESLLLSAYQQIVKGLKRRSALTFEKLIQNKIFFTNWD